MRIIFLFIFSLGLSAMDSQQISINLGGQSLPMSQEELSIIYGLRMRTHVAIPVSELQVLEQENDLLRENNAAHVAAALALQQPSNHETRQNTKAENVEGSNSCSFRDCFDCGCHLCQAGDVAYGCCRSGLGYMYSGISGIVSGASCLTSGLCGVAACRRGACSRSSSSSVLPVNP